MLAALLAIASVISPRRRRQESRRRKPGSRRPRRHPCADHGRSGDEMPVGAGRRGRHQARVLRHPERPDAARGPHHHAAAAPRRSDAHLRPPQPPHLLGRADESQTRLRPLYGGHRRAGDGQHPDPPRRDPDRVPGGRRSVRPHQRRRRARRRQGRRPDRRRAHPPAHPRSRERDQPARRESHGRSRRRHRDLQLAGAADRGRQQRDDRVPARSAAENTGQPPAKPLPAKQPPPKQPPAKK